MPSLLNSFPLFILDKNLSSLILRFSHAFHRTWNVLTGHKRRKQVPQKWWPHQKRENRLSGQVRRKLKLSHGQPSWCQEEPRHKRVVRGGSAMGRHHHLLWLLGPQHFRLVPRLQPLHGLRGKEGMIRKSALIELS